MIYNSMPNTCSGVKGNCRGCQKRYNCLSYAIFMLENANGESQGIINGVMDGLETFTAMQANSKQDLVKSIDIKLTDTESRIEKILTDMSTMLNAYMEELNKKQESAAQTQQVQTAEFIENPETVENNEIKVEETSLARPTQKTFKEKKTFFGKTKWVEE